MALPVITSIQMNVFAFNASVMYNLGEILLSLSVNDCPLSVKCSETPAVAGFVNHREKMGELGKEAGTAAWTRGKGVGQTPPAGRAGQRCFQRQVSTPRPGTLAASRRRPHSPALCLSFDHALDLSSRLQLPWMSVLTLVSPGCTHRLGALGA